MPSYASGANPRLISRLWKRAPLLKIRDCRPRKKGIEEARDGLGPGDHFYYADEFNLSWMPTLKAIWGPKGQQVMIPTPAQPKKRYGIGAVDYHTGETVVLIRRRKRRREIAELLEALLEKHPTGRVYVAWDNSNTHEDDEVEAVLRGAAGRVVLLYLPTYSPWLNPIEMLSGGTSGGR